MSDEIEAHLRPGEIILSQEVLEAMGFNALEALKVLAAATQLAKEADDDDGAGDV